MKRLIYIYFSILCIIFFLFKNAHTDTIWQIGKSDGFFSEFSFAEKQIIEYNVPLNWELLLDQNDPNWGEFPAFLYPFSDQNVPQEIRINFDYLQDYPNPTLLIRARPTSLDTNMQIVLFKGDMMYIGNCSIDYRLFYDYKFPLGYIRRGFHEKNRITIKAGGSSQISIAFDALSLNLDHTDSDGDGVSDADEGDFYKDQNGVVCIPLYSYHPDPIFKKKIILHINKPEEETPCFREVVFLDPNVLNLPAWLSNDRFLPYGCLGFKVKDIGIQDKISLQISFIDKPPQALNPSVRFHTYQASNDWHETEFELLDGNSALILLNDGGVGDIDEEKGSIQTILILSYPKTLDVHIERGTCLIKAIQQRRDYGTYF